MNPVVSATNNLRVGLTVLQVLSGLVAVLGVLYIIAGFFFSSMLSSGNTVLASSNLLFVLLGLLVIASGLGYFYVIVWIKEWQARVSGWSQGQSLDKARLEKLTQTLSKWIVWSQWSPIIGVALVLALMTVGGAILGSLLGGLSGLGNSSGNIALSSLSGASLLGGLLALAVIVGAAPVVVLNWLILKSILTWLLEMTNRALGRARNINLLSQSNAVSSWFVFAQVVIGLGALLTVSSAVTGNGSSTNANAPLTLVLSLAVDLLNFMLLQWSKTFMFGVAGYAERHGSSAVDLSKV